MRAWLQVHPEREDPQAPLWIGHNPRNLGERISKHQVYGHWNRAIQLSGVPKFTPHDLRHTAATRDAESGYNELDLRTKYGWGAKSEMAAHYVKQRRSHQEDLARRSVGVGPDGLPVPLCKRDLDETACPFCAERIKAAAIKCKHCGERVPERDAVRPGDPKQDSTSDGFEADA